MSLQSCHYYVTLECNAACEFCPCWQNPPDPKARLAGAEEIKPRLREARIRGAKVVNITGGEPLLREDLPDLLKTAKNLGFYVNLYTNGILYSEKAHTIRGLADKIHFSLDYPVESEHDRSRGVECYPEVIAAIKLAKNFGEKPIINFTMTRDSVRFLPEMVDLSEKLEVFVWLNPVYDFSGTQGFAAATIDHIRYYSKRKTVLMNLAALEFIRTRGSNLLFSRCMAKETCLTILPDGEIIAPCYFNPGGKQGRDAVCSSCMRWPYMLPSFAEGFDKYRLLNMCSNWINRRKERVK